MANSKDHAVWLADKSAYQIQYRTQDGSLRVRDTIPMVTKLATGDSLRAMGGWVKTQDKLRMAALSILSEALAFGGEALEAYKGACPADKPLPKEFLSSFRDAEVAYFKQFLHADHPAHEAFMKSLPIVNDRQEKLEVGGKLNVERQFQYYLSTTRAAPSYSNAKNVVLSFWGYCGLSPVNGDGTCMVPPEVMRVMVAEVKVVEAPDNSIKGRLYAIRREMIAESKMPPDDDMPEILATLRDLFTHAEGLEKAAAERRSKRPQKGDKTVEALSDEAIRKMQESTGRVPTESKPDAKVPETENTAK